jgi:hypothetical protein
MCRRENGGVVVGAEAWEGEYIVGGWEDVKGDIDHHSSFSQGGALRLSPTQILSNNQLFFESVAMPSGSVPAGFLAVADEIWRFETWKERTKHVTLPFEAIATPQQTSLTREELQAVRALVHRIHSIEGYRKRLNAFKENNDNDRAGKAAWTKWFRKVHGQWGVQKDMEKVLNAYERHPRMLVGESGGMEEVSVRESEGRGKAGERLTEFDCRRTGSLR